MAYSSYQVIGIPCLELSGDNLTSSTVTLITPNYSETNFDVVATPGASNYVDQSGNSPVTLHGQGRPTTATTITILSQATGAPNEFGGYLYSLNSGTDYIGWTPALVFCGMETIAYSSSATDGFRYVCPTPVVYADGTVLTACYETTGAGTAGTIEFSVRSATTGTWASTFSLQINRGAGVVIGTGSDIMSPAICLMPNNTTVVIAYLTRIYDIAGSVTGDPHIVIAHSDTATVYSVWDVDSWISLVPNSSYSFDRICLVYDEVAGDLVMALRQNNGGTYSGLIYRSPNRGASWSLVSTIADARDHTLVNLGGGVLLYTATTAADNVYHPYRVTSGGVMALSTFGSSVSQTNLAAVVYPNGWVSVFGRGSSGAARYQVKAYTSRDRGDTWTASWAPETSSVYGPPDEQVASHLDITSGVFVAGTTLLLGNLTTITATVPYTLAAYRMGQHSSVTRTQGSQITWTPTDLPTAKNWGATGVATHAITSSAGGDLVLDINSVAARRYYTNTPTILASVVIWADLAILAGGSTANDYITIQCQAPTTAATAYSEVIVRFSTTQVRVYDNSAAAYIGSTGTFSASVRIQVLIALNGQSQKGSIWFRENGNAVWTNIVDNVSLGQTAAAGSSVSWGHTTNHTGQSQWYNVDVWSSTVANNRDVLERNLTDGQIKAVPACLSADSPMTPWLLSGGISAAWKGSPLMAGDTYTLATSSRTALARALPSQTYTSPRQSYVSASSPSSPTYALFDLGSGHYSRLGDIVGLMGRNCNIATAVLARHTGAAWSDILTLNFAESPCGAAGTVAWTRSAVGDRDILPNGSNSTPRYFEHNELAGCLIDLVDDAAAHYYGTIASNTEGQFSNASGVKQLRITLSTTALAATPSALTALATSAAAGTITIYWPDGIAMKAQASPSSRYYQLRWTLALSEVPNIGKLIPFAAHLMGRPEDQGAQWTLTANDESVTSPGGLTRGWRRGPAGRTWRFPYRNLLVAGQRFASGAVPSTGPGGEARATIDNNAALAEHVVREVGQTRPIIFAPECDFSSGLSSSTFTLMGSRRWLWGVPQPEVAITMGQGQRYGVGTLGNHRASFDWIIKEST